MQRIHLLTLALLLFSGVSVSCSRRPSLRPPVPSVTPDAAQFARPESQPQPRLGDTWTNPQDGSQMVFVPGGSSPMGNDPSEINAIWQRFGWPEEWKLPTITTDEAPRHQVEVAGFWICRYEVTNEQFARFVNETGYRTDAERAGAAWVVDFEQPSVARIPGASWQHPFGPESNLKGKEKHPVVQVSWNDAMAYVKWAALRLPTEAEWEYTAHAGKGHVFPWGNDLPGRTDRVDNLADEAFRRRHPNWDIVEGYDDGHVETAPVRSFAPNPGAVYDLGGNVAEWTSSVFQPYPYRAGDGRENPLMTGRRVLRGGSWSLNVLKARVAERSSYAADDARHSLGLRCARNAPI